MSDIPGDTTCATSYDARRAFALAVEYEREAREERAIADALRGHADWHDRHALDGELRAKTIRERLAADGELT